MAVTAMNILSIEISAIRAALFDDSGFSASCLSRLPARIVAACAGLTLTAA